MGGEQGQGEGVVLMRRNAANRGEKSSLLILIITELQWFRPSHLFRVNPEEDPFTTSHYKLGRGNNC